MMTAFPFTSRPMKSAPEPMPTHTASAVIPSAGVAFVPDTGKTVERFTFFPSAVL